MNTSFFGMPPDTRMTSLSGGRNSQVFLVQPPGREPLILKHYFKNPADDRDRQGSEAMALRFFEKAGIESVPRLLRLDKERQVSVLSYIKGTKITVPTTGDMNLAVAFIVELIRLSSTEEALKEDFSPASEAFFSVMDILKNIEMRLARLEEVTEECPLYRELIDFLCHQLRPAQAKFADHYHELLQSQGIGLEEYIPNAWRILSPSDFGMHNALKRQDGRLSFLDFEYFGWDDPAKILADFCLHPAMNLNETLKQRFLSGILPALTAKGYDSQRAIALFPLFGIKWCCILLNEFMPYDLARRSFTGNGAHEAYEQLLTRQLDKARTILTTLDSQADIFSRQLAANR